METIQSKLEGKEVVEAPTPAPTKVIDLMAALKASVEAAQKERQGEAARGPAARRRSAAG